MDLSTNDLCYEYSQDSVCLNSFNCFLCIEKLRAQKKKKKKNWHKTVCNFQSMKCSVELNSLLSKFFCYITWLLYQLIRRDTGRLANEAFTWNPIVSLKQKLNGLKITNWKGGLQYTKRTITTRRYTHFFISNAFFNSAAMLVNFVMNWASNVP